MARPRLPNLGPLTSILGMGGSKNSARRSYGQDLAAELSGSLNKARLTALGRLLTIPTEATHRTKLPFDHRTICVCFRPIQAVQQDGR